MSGTFKFKANHCQDPPQCAHFQAEEIFKDQPPGSYFIAECPAGDFGVHYVCPGCGVRDFMGVKGGDWNEGHEWDGNRESPTLKPSVLHRLCGWHGYLEEGNWRDA